MLKCIKISGGREDLLSGHAWHHVNYVHDKMYKTPDRIAAEISRDPQAFKSYTHRMSDYYFKLDSGVGRVNKP